MGELKCAVRLSDPAFADPTYYTCRSHPNSSRLLLAETRCTPRTGCAGSDGFSATYYYGVVGCMRITPPRSAVPVVRMELYLMKSDPASRFCFNGSMVGFQSQV